MAEVLLIVAALGVPLALGAITAYLGWPWWWGAVVAVLVFLTAAIAPEPEKGEPRVAAGDILFLLIVALLVTGLVWLGAWTLRRLSSR